ncbi:nSTAND1 domain-containing NTPase [Pseudofrankia inefficax]|uniref:nSTAND1 domain-containing NTPase n=1 Tax=Pseudofrankia inefficax (strain DSM 45817 / CECT 9037 / DDB 130130 / EuI1c) TaxID=298654 RepID=UPI001E4F5FD7|nr:TIR domain-containing protein [Pseudofrankia inefficax]
MRTGAEARAGGQPGDDGADFFVSYAHGDEAWAEWISWQLEEAGYRVVVQAWDFLAGTHFVHEMHRAAMSAARTLAVVSAAYLTSAFSEAQWQAAWMFDPSGRERRLVPVRVEDCPLPGLLGQLVSVDVFGRSRQTAREQLLAAVASERAKPDQPPRFPGQQAAAGAPGSPRFPGPAEAGDGFWRGRSPFPGLEAFDASRAAVFKARDEDTRLLAARLRAPAGDAAGLLTVVGPSGCGKSSLVAAGLAPALGKDSDWLVLRPITPSGDPLVALAGALASAGRHLGLGWDAPRLADRLARPETAAQLVDELLAAAEPTARRLLLIIDQAEELLARGSPASQVRFLVLLAALTRGPVRAVATLRSEYLDQLIELAARAGLPVRAEALNPLPRELLHLVIVEPVRLAGLTIEDELVARMVADTGDGQALPLLAYTLQRLHAAAGEAGTAVLSAALYAHTGGVRGALIDHADAALAEAVTTFGCTDGQVLAGLLRLVTVDGEGRPVSRRVPLDQLPDGVRGVLTPFVAHRLLSVGRDPAGGPVTVELTHERLLTAWPPLATATRDRSAALVETRRVEQAAAEWDHHDQDDGYLWPGTRVDTALSLLDVADDTPKTGGTRGAGIAAGDDRTNGLLTALDARSRRFLTVSADRAHQRARRERRQRRTIRGTAALLALIVLVVPTVLFLNQRGAADRARRQTAVLDLLSRADAARGADPAQAARFALAARSVAPDGAGRTRAEATLLSLLTAPHPVGGLLTGYTDPDTVITSGSSVASVAYSPDGLTLASGSDAGLRLWNVTNPRAPAPLGKPLSGDAVTAVAFSRVGHILAGGSENGIQLWDLTNSSAPAPLGRRLSSSGAVTSVAFSPDGHVLASGSDGGLRLWNLTNPSAPAPLGRPLSSDAVTAVAFSTDGHTVASGSDDGTIRLWSLTNPGAPKPLDEPLINSSAVTAVAFSLDGHTLASGSVDHTIQLWNLTNHSAPISLGGPPIPVGNPVWSVAFASDGHTLASGSRDGVQLWNLTNPTAPAPLGSPLINVDATTAAASVAFSPDGHTLASGSDVDTIQLWDLAKASAPAPLGKPLTSGTGVASVAFAPDSHALASGSDDNKIQLWNLADSSATAPVGETLTDVYNAVVSVAFSRDGHTLASGSEGGLRLWDLTNPTAPAPLGDPLTSDDVTSVAFSRDGHTLAGGFNDGTVRLWNLTNPSAPTPLGKPLPGSDDTVTSVAFSADGHTLVSGSDAGTIRRWNLTNPNAPTPLGKPLTSTDPVTSVAFSPDGHTLASGTETGTIRLWNLTNPTAPAPLGNPLTGTDWVTSVAFSPDGDTLASGSRDHTIQLWNLTNPTAPAPLGNPLTGHTREVMAVAFSADGHTLASGSKDHTIRLWDLRPLANLRSSVAAETCAWAGELPKAEWNSLMPGISFRAACNS